MNKERLADVLDSINQLPGNMKLGIIALIIAVLVGGYWYWSWSPKVAQLRVLTVKIQDKKKVLNEYKLITEQLPEFKKEFEKLTLQFEAAARKLPSKKEIPGLIDGIYEAVGASGLKPLTFTPKGEIRREVYAEIPVKMNVIGSYYSLATFFDKISRLPRVVNIQDLKLTKTRGSNSSRNLDASFTAVTFRVLPLAPPSGKKKPGKGKRR